MGGGRAAAIAAARPGGAMSWVGRGRCGRGGCGVADDSGEGPVFAVDVGR